MDFSSDTSASAHPAVLEALARINHGSQPSYGADEITAQLRQRLSVIFECDVEILPVVSGTAANALCLSLLYGPLQSVICHEEAHIERDERGAPEFFSAGGKLSCVSGQHARIDPVHLKALCEKADPEFVHETPPAAVSLTNLTESGTRYSLDQVAEICDLAKAFGLNVHMDGARFANAIVNTGWSPAQITWKSGVQCMSLGFTKNGAIGCDIIVLFGDMRQRIGELRARAKRAGHLPPKMRFISVQALALLEGDLWLSLAEHANQCAAEVSRILLNGELGVLAHPVEGNEVFAKLPETIFDQLRQMGLKAYPWLDGSIRFVCHWATQKTELVQLDKASSSVSIT